MNIFEDLIEELKEENLLEETVTEVQSRNNGNKTLDPQIKKSSVSQNFDSPVLQKNSVKPIPVEIVEPAPSVSLNSNKPLQQKQSPPVEDDFVPLSDSFVTEIEDEPILVPDVIQHNFERNDFSLQPDFSEPGQELNQTEFYKKRATDEVTSLQMVEHVLSGVERNFLHLTPKLYDDLEIKKSLHNFLQNSHNINSPEHAQAEFQLMQETESWYSALSQKDKNINVNFLRRYCETTRPILSGQALAALARFYRNAPFSESIRSKFDQVITRCFARETGNDIRKLSAGRDEIIEKLNDFYAEWSSIPLYATEDDESEILLAAIKFEEFMTEAEEAESFEELIKNDFFNRLKSFKETTHENFFAPLITAASIESNVRIGNRYLELLLNEKENVDAESLEEKYGEFHSQVISEVVCKTLLITNVFEGKFADADVVQVPVETGHAEHHLEFEKQDLNKQPQVTKVSKDKKEAGNNWFRVNKLLLGATVLVFLCSVGLYVYANFYNPAPNLPESVKTVNLDNSSLKEYIQTARLNNDMFYGIVNQNWDSLDKDKKEELLRKVILVGGEKGFTRVSLMDRQGRSVGYASPDKVEVYNP